MVAIGAGIGAWIALVIASGSEWLPYYPWAAPGLAMRAEFTYTALLVSTACFLAATIGGGFHITRREVS